MPEITREKLSAKLDTIPEGDREPYLQALKAKGYTWKSNGAPTEQAPSQARPAADAGEALLTNLPAEGFKQNLIRGLPAALGSVPGVVAGAALGTAIMPGPGTVIGGILGAGLGGATGEATRQAVAQGTAAAFPEQNYPIQKPGQVLRDVAIQGASQAAGEAGGQLIGAAAKAARPTINKLGAQAMRVGAGIPEKAGDAVMRNPSLLLDAPSKEVASGGYKAFERYTGLSGLGDQVKLTGKFPSEGELEKHLFEVAARAKNGVSSTPQELYLASQAASSLNQLGKMGNPRYAMLKGAIGEAKNVVDDALEAALPEYKNLRSDYAASKIAGEFSSAFPLNKNTSPNVLRGVTAASGAAAGLAAGHPAALAALPLVSPMVYGGAVRTAALAGKVPAGVYRVGAAALTGAAGSSLADAYARQPRPALP
jgi:hypothetical protein